MNAQKCSLNSGIQKSLCVRKNTKHYPDRSPYFTGETCIENANVFGIECTGSNICRGNYPRAQQSSTTLPI